MKAASRQTRKAEIEACAYALLETGDDALTMQALAKSARASMETLYRWYGDRQGLFAALVAGNAAIVTEELSAIEAVDATEKLEKIAPTLLRVLLGPRAIALNRAAATDRTGELGAALRNAGREAVGPRLAEIIGAAQQSGALGHGHPREITESFVNLLIGDMQIRVATRAAPPPDEAAIKARSARAIAQLQKLYPPR